MINTSIWFGRTLLRTIGAVAVTLAVLFAASAPFPHGGKGHAAGSFTPLQALQKATGLYDQLVANGKLPDSWETRLTRVGISQRQKDGRKEYVVSFHRSDGDPRTVYIFFSIDGKYAGSNFTGE